MRIVLISLLFIICKVPVFSQDCHCIKPEFEMGAGPQLSSGIIKEFEIPGSPELNSKPGGLAYSFHLSVRTHLAKWQAGLDMIQDMINLSVYYPVYFPGDYPDHIGDSKWYYDYKAYRLGVGAHVRMNFNSAFTEFGVAYLNSVADEFTDQIKSWSGDGAQHENGSYDGKSGVTLRALFGTKIGSAQQKRFSWHVGVSYDTGLNQFTDETFQQSWSYHNIAYAANVNYQLNRIE